MNMPINSRTNNAIIMVSLEVQNTSRDSIIELTPLINAEIKAITPRYASATTTSATKTIPAISPPLRSLFLPIKTSRSVIDTEIHNCFPAEAHRDFPISIAAGRKQLCESSQREEVLK